MHEGYTKEDLGKISKQGNRFLRLAEYWKTRNKAKSQRYYGEYARMTKLGYSLHYGTIIENE